MSDAFISYRRKGSLSLAYLLQEILNNDYNFECYLDVTHSSSANIQFSQRLMQAIEDAPVFICLLNKDTLSSEPVLKEIRKAYELKKPCIPVFQEGYEIAAELEDAVLYLHKYDAVHILDARGLFIAESVAKIAHLIESIQGNKPAPPPQNLPKPKPKNKSKMPTFGMGAIVIALLIIIAIGVFNRPSTSPESTPVIQVAQAVSNTNDEVIVESTLVSTAIYTATPDNLVVLGTSDANSIAPDSLTMTATAYIGATSYIRMTQNRLSVTTTAEARSTNDAQEAIDAYAPIGLAIDSVENNYNWTLYRQQFGSAFMVLVPSGCFRVGNADGGVFEQPVHTRCLENPYWIDQYEVSNGQFDNLGGQTEEESHWSLSTLPRENITWQEARDFCALRDARLPTELEWEYAARGVNSLVYPWGNTLILNRVIFAETSSEETTFITDFDLGASWVGAYHMLGNVSEWTSSQFLPYPYDNSDGREDMESTEQNRVIRGGNYNTIREQLNTTIRINYPPNTSSRVIGFRCARDFSLSDIEN